MRRTISRLRAWGSPAMATALAAGAAWPTTSQPLRPSEAATLATAGFAVPSWALAAALVAGLAQQAVAESPEGCHANSVTVGITAMIDGSAVQPGQGVMSGDELTFRVTVASAPHSPSAIYCDVEGGQLSVTLPDGTMVGLAGYAGIAELAQFGNDDPTPSYELDVAYTVDAADADENGVLVAYADYGHTAGRPEQLSGHFMSEPLEQSASGSAAIGVRVTCEEDLNGDGVVDMADLGALLGSWGPCEDCDADLNGDGLIDANDLAALLASFGACS